MVPQRKRRLQTFNVLKKKPNKIKQKEREQKLVSVYLRKQLAWSEQTQCAVNSVCVQYLELPRALCTPSGEPHKGQKSYTTKVYEKRYSTVIQVPWFVGPWYGTIAFRNHEKSVSHREAVEVILTLPSTTRDIGEQLSQQHAAQKLKNRQALYQILSLIRFLGRQGLAVRGDGNE